MIAPFLTILNQLQIFHWQTISYAEHKALGKAYENLQGLFDKFIETYYGKYDRPHTSESYEYKINVINYRGNIVDILSSAFETCIEEIDHKLNPKDNELKNIRDEIQGEFHHIIYLLILK